VALVLVAKRETGMWTHMSFSFSLLRKGLSNLGSNRGGPA